jgi:HAD superfamily hydrolase (TIGR01549 family)
MARIKLVVFDAGGVLFDFEEGFDWFLDELRKMFERNGAKFGEDGEDFWEDREVRHAVESGKITLREARIKHLRMFGLDENLIEEYEDIDRKSFLKFRIIEESTRSVLEMMKNQGYKISVLSDSTHGREDMELKLESVGLGSLFDFVVSSADIRHRKPDMEAYMYVLNHFGLEPGEAVFVAHDEDEISGARKLGIKTISYRGHESGDFIVRKFTDILSVLKELG